MVQLSLVSQAQTGKEEESASHAKVVAAKNELSKKLLADPSVLGIGIGSAGDASHSAETMNVYVSRDASNETLGHIPKKYKGISVSVVKSEPFKSQ